VRNKVRDFGVAFGSMVPMRIVLESSCKSFWLADQLRLVGHQPIVVDPVRTKAIGASWIKHDKLDAMVLAEVKKPKEPERLADQAESLIQYIQSEAVTRSRGFKYLRSYVLIMAVRKGMDVLERELTEIEGHRSIPERQEATHG